MAGSVAPAGLGAGSSLAAVATSVGGPAFSGAGSVVLVGGGASASDGNGGSESVLGVGAGDDNAPGWVPQSLPSRCRQVSPLPGWARWLLWAGRAWSRRAVGFGIGRLFRVLGHSGGRLALDLVGYRPVCTEARR